jgi:predicted alpha-1,2-mannosidase
MKKQHYFFLCGLFLLIVASGCQNGYSRYVNPLVGTDFHGHTYPGAIVPFGQIQPSPDTRLEGWDGCSAYHYSDDTIYGFSHTHLNGTGCEDYGDILLMPVTATGDSWTFSPDMPQTEFCSRFSHRGEKATPGYYRVVLDRNRVMAELTTTERVACHRYTFPGRGLKGFVIDLRHRDKVLSAGFDKAKGDIISGWRKSDAWNPDQKCFFALQCNQPVKEVKYFDHGMKALVVLPDDCKQAEVYVSISGVDSEGARKNLATRQELAFDDIRSAAHQRWEEALGKIEVEGGSRTEKQNFYTALYHCYTSPYLWSDVDGRYRAMNDSICTSDKPIYTVFSLWDTYRALHPLMAIIEPKITEDWINTMLNQFETGGELTMWELAAYETHCMIGYHACPVILVAQETGILDSWTDRRRLELLEAMISTSNRSETHLAYAAQGYLDSKLDNETVSKTLEYSYDDWCIARYAYIEMMRGVFKPDTSATYRHLQEVYNTYMRRAQSWQNIMDPDGFMHARRNGGFVTPFNPTEVNNHFTEANSWQYSTYVPHDVSGWIAQMGGIEKAEAFLDSLFNTSSETTGRDQVDITGCIGQYAHGNEPSHHAAYLYAYLGATDKLDNVVHRILSELYTPKPDGLCGNEDCGQMSAWYVMSAMGFYPVCPGSGEYVTVTPLFDRVTLHTGKDDIVINKSDWKPGQFWDGKAFSPRSKNLFPEEVRTPPAPVFSDWQQCFKDSLFVSLSARSIVNGNPEGNKSVDGKSVIYYTTDGRTPDTHAFRYVQPILVNRDITLKAVAYNPATDQYSPVVSQTLTRFIADKQLRYITKPAPQYSENGPDGLIDRLYGTSNYRIGGWQGWQTDMEVVIDLLSSKTLTSVTVDCLDNMRAWIFFPKRFEVSISSDGKTYRPWAQLDNDEFPVVRERQEESVQHAFVCRGPLTSARYVKVKAVNYGPMPEWHISAGEQPWIFVDEIEVGSHLATFVSSFSTDGNSNE